MKGTGILLTILAFVELAKGSYNENLLDVNRSGQKLLTCPYYHIYK